MKNILSTILIYSLIFCSQLIAQECQLRNYIDHNSPNTPALEIEEYSPWIFSAQLEPLPEELCDKILSNSDPKLRPLINRLINPLRRSQKSANTIVLLGTNRTEKIALSRALIQKMRMPYLFIKGSYIAERKIDFSTISYLTKLLHANLIIDEMQLISSNTDPNNNDQSDIPCAFSELLDDLEKKHLLFIGIADKVYNLPQRLIKRLVSHVCVMN